MTSVRDPLRRICLIWTGGLASKYGMQNLFQIWRGREGSISNIDGMNGRHAGGSQPEEAGGGSAAGLGGLPHFRPSGPPPPRSHALTPEFALSFPNSFLRARSKSTKCDPPSFLIASIPEMRRNGCRLSCFLQVPSFLPTFLLSCFPSESTGPGLPCSLPFCLPCFPPCNSFHVV